MSRIIQILSILCVALHIPISAAAQVAAGSDGVYQWVPERLIPNEFGLPNGTWANASIRDCISKCSADKLCSGFSIQKSFGDALRGGCKDGLCDQKTECHAKGPYGSSVLWTVGAKVCYLPAYSPDLNPIEMAFSKLKAALRKGAKRTVKELCIGVSVAKIRASSGECGMIQDPCIRINRPECAAGENR